MSVRSLPKALKYFFDIHLGIIGLSLSLSFVNVLSTSTFNVQIKIGDNEEISSIYFPTQPLNPKQKNLIYLTWESYLYTDSNFLCLWEIKVIKNSKRKIRGIDNIHFRNHSRITIEMIRAQGLTDEWFSINVSCPAESENYNEAMQNIIFKIWLKYEVTLEVDGFREQEFYPCSYLQCIFNSVLNNAKDIQTVLSVGGREYPSPSQPILFPPSKTTFYYITCTVRFYLDFQYLRGFSQFFIQYQSTSISYQFEKTSKHIPMKLQLQSCSSLECEDSDNTILLGDGKIICSLWSFSPGQIATLRLSSNCDSMEVTEEFDKFKKLELNLTTCRAGKFYAECSVRLNANERPKMCYGDAILHKRKLNFFKYELNNCTDLSQEHIWIELSSDVLVKNFTITVRRTPCLAHWPVSLEIKEAFFMPTIYAEDDAITTTTNIFQSTFGQALVSAIAKPPSNLKLSTKFTTKRVLTFMRLPKNMQISVSSLYINVQQLVQCLDVNNPFIKVTWEVKSVPLGVPVDGNEVIEINGDWFQILYTAKTKAGFYVLICNGKLFNESDTVSTRFKFNLRLPEIEQSTEYSTETFVRVTQYLMILYMITIIVIKFKTLKSNIRRKVIKIIRLFKYNCKNE